MIKCLPTEVQGRLRSGVAIPSLQQCVEELILNSIDAGATCVGVRMDMEAFKVQVIDNGAGMSVEDMDCVGNRYHTSKCSSIKDLENLRWYGFRGEALASIVSLATLVEISSRTKSSVKTHVKLFKGGKGLDVFEAETSRPSAGTTVIICNFFHNMPVRRKRLDAVLEGERIRHRLEAVSLMHPSVSFTLKNDCTGAMMVQLSKARNTYHRFVQIHTLARAEKLGEISYTHRQFEVIGYLGKEGHYNNSFQFLYVNDRLLLKTRLHKLLNVLLRRLSSSNQKNDSPDGQSAIRSPKHKRNQELYGVYIINIKCSYSEYDICLEPAKTLIEFKDWDGILLCVEEAVKAFLRRENLVSVFSQDDLDGVSSKVFGTDRTDQEEASDKAGQTAIATSTPDCSFALKLSSEFVHRKNADPSLESGLVESNAGETEQLKEREISGDKWEEIQQCDAEPASPDITDEEEPTFGEGVNVLHTPNGQEDEPLKEQEKQSNCATSVSNVNSQHSILQPVQSDLRSNEKIAQCTDKHGQTLVSNRKISVPDPYIHESLQIQDLSQHSRPVVQVQNLAIKCEEKSFVSKRKISLEVDRDRSSQRQCGGFASVIPSKIPRVVSCQKLSAFSEPGSLDKFRRTFVKSDGMKLPDPHLQDKARLPQGDSFTLNPRSVSVRQYDPHEEEDAESQKEEETQSSVQSSTTLSAVKAQNRGKKSLAAKLNQLKQNRTEDPEVLLHTSRNTSEDKFCLSSGGDGAQASNNNQNPQDSALHVDSVSGCRTNPQLAGEEEDLTSSDWLPHYDTSVGKTVYVNRMTGLSRYENPALEETHVRCTSDVTNMAVSVTSKMGMEYRCYPFQVDLVFPFLPKSRPERVISSGIDCRDDAGESSNSLSSLYSKWNNPVFVRPPMVGVDISSGQADGLAVKIHNILFPYRFSKAMIHSMKVIHQVDKKFLACLINTEDEEHAAGNLLVLVDQHAAHERVRLENLVADSYEDDPDAPGERRLCSSLILPPLEISVTEEELRLLRSCQPHLRSLGLEVTFSQAAAPQVFVGKVPVCFMEKESNELRRGRPSVIKPIVEEYLREQIELLRSTGRVRGTLPLSVLKVLASLACHGAIKFNDPLSRDECCSLVASLSSCQLPFQCAHGRPSIAPLVDILHLDKDQKDFQKPNLQKLRRMHKAWELYGNG
ncbi:DNA mismatch repair protein Mlh3 [Odontesthes bonariensis]|uniref:DNA mismatch repair protein Mlh3 isoform X1 n=1 Tax=Odontesthes bonariensis TaxID=219752 RepID=UPI003F589EB1